MIWQTLTSENEKGRIKMQMLNFISILPPTPKRMMIPRGDSPLVPSLEVPKMEQLAVFLRTMASWVIYFLVFVLSLSPFAFSSVQFLMALHSPIILEPISFCFNYAFSGSLPAANIFLSYTSKNSSTCRNAPKSNFNYLQTF